MSASYYIQVRKLSSGLVVGYVRVEHTPRRHLKIVPKKALASHTYGEEAAMALAAFALEHFKKLRNYYFTVRP